MNYQEGQQYPMIVHLYELLSHRLNVFTHPSARETYNMMNFVLQGYFVFQPDIRYEINHPGESAADCVIAAVQEVLKRGDIDSMRLGLLGHSWGLIRPLILFLRLRCLLQPWLVLLLRIWLVCTIVYTGKMGVRIRRCLKLDRLVFVCLGRK